MLRPIYLDNNATTCLDPTVLEAMVESWRSIVGNPASQHQPGQQAHAALENTRETIARLLGAGRNDRLIFTSGGTEANHLALGGLAGDRPGQVLISAIEHPSLLGAANLLRDRGLDIERIPVLSTGQIDVDCLARLLTSDTRLVSVMLANNETGVLQPLRELISICHARDIPVHTDGVQAIGKIPVSFRELGVDAMSLAPHKFHGPVGIGGLLLRAGRKLRPLFQGGFQQAGLRPGSESVALAVGFRVALERSDSGGAAAGQELARLRDRFESELSRKLDVVVHGQAVARLPQTSSISFLGGWDRQRLFLALDMAGVACSTGSACASGSSEPSAVLQAMGLPEEQLRGALRFSFGRQNTELDVDEALHRIFRIFKQLQSAKLPEKLAVVPRHSASDPL